MKKTILFKTMLLLCALIVGSSSAWADEEPDVTYDFTGNGWTVSNGTLSDGTVTFTGEGNGSFKMNSGYFIMGKSGAYINFPTYTSDVEKIVVTGRGGASSAVKQNIFVGDVAVSTETEGATGTNTYEIAEAYQTAGTQYTLKVTSSHNTQITMIEVYYANNDKETITLSFPEDNYTADIADGFSAPTLSKDAEVDVTYTSSNEDVATVDGETGAVTLVGKGVTTITATFAGDDNYKAASASYTLTVTNRNANDGSQAKPFTVAEAIDFIKALDYDENTDYYVKGIISRITSTSVLSGGYLTYYISDDGTTTNDLQVYKGKNLDNTDFTDVSDIEVGDNVTIVGPLFYYSNKTPEFNVGNYIYTTDHKNRADAGLTVVADFGMEVTTTKPVEDVYEKESDGEVTITSDNEAVIKVEDGLLKALSVGSAVITVSVAKTETYKAASANFTVKVRAKTAVEPEGQGAGSTSSYFVKVTSTDDITNGNYLIVYEGDTYNDAFDGSLQTLDKAVNGITVTINDNTIAATEKLLSAVFTIDKTNGTLKSASGYYIGVTSNSNGLKSSENADTYKNTFAIDESGNAVISAVFESSSMTLRYNSAKDDKRFRYYKNSSQKPIQLYKYVEVAGENTFDIKVSAAGWRGLVTAVDATLPEGLTAYTVADNDGTTVTLNETFTVKANTPYIVKGNEGTYTLTVAEEEVEAPENNLLQISTKNTGNGVYVLYNGASGVGFYLWSGGSLGAGRVYLPATTNAREFIGLDSETTGISTVNSEAKSLFNGEFFNMAGQRVAKPAKGLYIVNGKKVVIK